MDEKPVVEAISNLRKAFMCLSTLDDLIWYHTDDFSKEQLDEIGLKCSQLSSVISVINKDRE